MLITNDVALITFVPFALELLRMVNRKDRIVPVVVCQTLAANLGSMTTPVGNPQNLYLYSVSDLTTAEFAWATLPYAGLSLLLLTAVIIAAKDEPLLENCCNGTCGIAKGGTSPICNPFFRPVDPVPFGGVPASPLPAGSDLCHGCSPAAET